jgi:hypothetical protein
MGSLDEGVGFDDGVDHEPIRILLSVLPESSSSVI